MLRLSSAVTLCLMFFFSTAHAQRNSEWIPLGEQSIGFRVSHDIIKVGQSEEWFANRSFRSLVIVAERAEAYMMSVRVVYLNGFTEDFRVNEYIQRGGQLEIDLTGERSYLKQIEMIYRARPDLNGDASLKVFAQPWRRVGGNTGGSGNWTELGCQEVSLFGRDRDTVRVGRQEGRFRAIRLYARNGDVEVLDLKVIYTNGQPDDISVQSLIRSGDRTRPLDLRGRERAIDRIELVYRNMLNPANIIGGQGIRVAIVCVEGLQ